MGTIGLDKTTLQVEPEAQSEPFWVSVLVAAAATSISFAVAGALFSWFAGGLEPWRGPHTAGFFAPLSSDHVLAAVWFLTGLVTLRMRSKALLLILGLYAAARILFPVFAWSGSAADARIAEALRDARNVLLGVGWLVNTVLLVEWMRFGWSGATRRKLTWL